MQVKKRGEAKGAPCPILSPELKNPRGPTIQSAQIDPSIKWKSGIPGMKPVPIFRSFHHTHTHTHTHTHEQPTIRSP